MVVLRYFWRTFSFLPNTTHMDTTLYLMISCAGELRLMANSGVPYTLWYVHTKA